MMVISKIVAREILDSRGFPTVEADVYFNNNTQYGRAAVPSGASTGSKEALELRDQDKSRYLGKGVQKAIANIEKQIAPKLIGKSIAAQKEIDDTLIELDGTEYKTNLGANATLAVSMAVARAAAIAKQVPLYQHLAQGQTLSLPVPLMNIVNGGAHADNTVDIQEFMIVPSGFSSFSLALQAGVEIYQALKGVLKKQGLSTGIGDEGGFAPNLKHNEDAIELILAAIESAGFKAGKDVYLALDIAATEFFKDGHYHLESENKALTPDAWIQLLQKWQSHYPIISIEDAMAEDDWAGWQGLSQALGQKVQLVGDDLFVTNKKLLQEGISRQVANAILIKLNQIGTLTETLDTIALAKQHDYQFIISHRSGETGDTFIADLAVASNAGQIKTGAPCRTDRIAKYNQLLRIEAATQGVATYAGVKSFTKWIR